MTAPISDGREKRIANDTQMIFMARTMERLYGAAALDDFVARQMKKVKTAWRQKARDTGRRDLDVLLGLFNDDAHEYKVLRHNPNCLEVKVARCVHADVFKSYNAADLGEKLICQGDHAVVAGLNPQITLTRPETCMTGKCCHFIFKRRRRQKIPTGGK